MNRHIIVNATALKRSGGLTILEQFIEAVPSGKYEYIVFADSSVSLSLSKANIRIIHKSIKSFAERFLWDSFGVKGWLHHNKIKPVATISLQNTNFRTDRSIPNFVYFHNAIPLSDARWNPFNKSERALWFYKNIYPFFIRLYINRNTEIFVQSNSVSDSFAGYFHFPKAKIHIIVPKITMDIRTKSNDPSIDRNRLNLFYPATNFIFKNHLTIIKAISMLERDLQQRITLHLTCKEQDLPFKIANSEIPFKINFLDKIGFGRVLQLYEESDALLFPSYIETLGLPLIEAASIGMPVIVSDLPYSREILNNYPGAKFVKYDDAPLWSEEISKLFTTKGHRYVPFKFGMSDSWQELFRILEDRINKVA
jgi:glycosyltransferase involved in cell wall biosynthesis